MSKSKLIAFHLPQYHLTPDNDKLCVRNMAAFMDIVGTSRFVFHAHYLDKEVHSRITYICDLNFTTENVPRPILGNNILQPFVTRLTQNDECKAVLQ